MTEPQPAPGNPARLTWTEMAALALSVALVPLNSTMIAVAMPSIARDLGVPAPELTQWLVTSYLVIGIALQSPAGKLGDGLGHARALSLGQGVFAAGAITGWFGRSIAVLAASRSLMAAGGAVMVPASMALVRVRVPAESRSKAFGAFGAVMGLAAAVGPLLGGRVEGRFGWPALFAVNAAPIALAALLGSRVGAAARKPMPRFDLLGGALLAASLVALVVGARAVSAVWLVAGVALFGAFVAWERRVADPVVDLGLFRVRAFAMGTAVVGLQNVAIYALIFEVPLALQRATGSTPRSTGEVLAALTLAMVTGSLVGGRLVARSSERAIAIAGAVVTLAGMALLATRQELRASALVPGLAVLGLGCGIVNPAVQSAALGAIGPARSGMAAGVSATVRYLGASIGVSIATQLASATAVQGGHHATVLALTLALVVAGACSVALPRAAD